MKASEKIKHYHFHRDPLDLDGNEMCWIGAIEDYLDEEKERVNNILHEIISALHDGSFDTQNCNYLHQMIDEKIK